MAKNIKTRKRTLDIPKGITDALAVPPVDYLRNWWEANSTEEERVHQRREDARLAREAAELAKEESARKIRIEARRTIRKWIAEGVIRKRYSIVVPSTETEMQAEGHAMGNCVGDYWSGHGWRKGECELAFLRKDGKPYIDIEMRKGQIVQARYKGNVEVPQGSKDYALCALAQRAFNWKIAA